MAAMVTPRRPRLPGNPQKPVNAPKSGPPVRYAKNNSRQRSQAIMNLGKRMKTRLAIALLLAPNPPASIAGAQNAPPAKPATPAPAQQRPPRTHDDPFAPLLQQAQDAVTRGAFAAAI